MITSASTVNATYGKSTIYDVWRVNPGPQERMKPPETPAAPTIPDNDAEIASINTNPLRGELANTQSALRQHSTITSAIQNYRQLFATLTERRDQISEQVKEPSQLESMAGDKKDQQQAVWKQIEASNKQINDIVDSARLVGNKIFTAAGQDMAISVSDGVAINIPAKDFGVNLTDVDLSENPDTLLEKLKRAIQAIMDNGELLLGVKTKKESFTTLMEFELRDILDVEENTTEKNMTPELAKFSSLAWVQEDMHKALRGQANVNPDAAAALLINTN